jgi:hypothetical protein
MAHLVNIGQMLYTCLVTAVVGRKLIGYNP